MQPAFSINVLLATTWILLLLEWTSANPVDSELQPPDPQKVPKSHFLESKLANTRLGPHLEHIRAKRDREETAKDLQIAEADTAAAAIEAEHAKDDAIKALAQNVHLEKTLSAETAVASGNSPGSRAQQENTSDNEAVTTSTDDDYYEDEDEAQETIVEDSGGNITATFITVDEDREKVTESKTSETPIAISSTTTSRPSSEAGTCKGLVDLTTMTDDFRKRLQLLLDEEQQAIDRLNNLHNSMQNTAERLRKVARGPTNYGTPNVEPSKACVYISEPSSLTNSQTPEFQTEPKPSTSDTGDTQGKLHIYTSQGIFPKKNSAEVLPPLYSQNGQQQQQYLRIMQGHLTSDTNARHDQTVPNGPDSASHYVKREENSSKDLPQAGLDHTDVDLENVFWIKPNEFGGSVPENSSSPQALDSVMKMLRSQGKDVLIIPISSKFDNVKDVAFSFLDAVKARKDVHKVQKKLKMKIRRIR